MARTCIRPSPYTSYQRLSGEDVRDLYAYMMTLPAEDDAVPEHQLKFPFNMRRGVGLWRLAFLDGKPWQPGPVPAELSGDMAKAYQRGEYLVEGAGHCAECHSSRGFMGNVLAESRYGGGPDTTGTGWFPNITPDETGIGFWSAASLARYLHTGVSPIGRAADGDMAEVIRNTSQMSAGDIGADGAVPEIPAACVEVGAAHADAELYRRGGDAEGLGPGVGAPAGVGRFDL